MTTIEIYDEFDILDQQQEENGHIESIDNDSFLFNYNGENARIERQELHQIEKELHTRF